VERIAFGVAHDGWGKLSVLVLVIEEGESDPTQVAAGASSRFARPLNHGDAYSRQAEFRHKRPL
jgi:hypothetical protein